MLDVEKDSNCKSKESVRSDSPIEEGITDQHLLSRYESLSNEDKADVIRFIKTSFYETCETLDSHSDLAFHPDS